MTMIDERDRRQAQAHTRRARVVTLELAPADVVADAIVRRLTSVSLVPGPASRRREAVRRGGGGAGRRSHRPAWAINPPGGSGVPDR
jgi:hypothetical protein